MIRIKLARYARSLLGAEDSSERLALAFASGVFLALTPFVGLHTILAIAVAFLFGLNRVAILVGLFLNNPWTYVPYYTMATYFGRHLIRFPQNLAFPDFRWSQLWHSYFWVQLAHHWRLIMPMMLGSTILAVLGAVLSYPLALYAIRRGRAALGRQHTS